MLRPWCSDPECEPGHGIGILTARLTGAFFCLLCCVAASGGERLVLGAVSVFILTRPEG